MAFYLEMREHPEHPLYSRQKDEMSIGGLSINFQRTTRVPEGQLNSLPAGLGSFPLYTVADFREGCPKDWRPEGYFMPMYPQEAMWMNFRRSKESPLALLVGAGNINAVTGKEIPYKKVKGRKGAETLDIKLEEPQNYLVIPPQPWLDGWKAPDDKIYQFVAAELGSGQTVEGQITGKEEVGGIQLAVFAPKPGKIIIPESRPREYIESGDWAGKVYSLCAMRGSSERAFACAAAADIAEMGLGRGGEIHQKIYDDIHGLAVWVEEALAKTALYIVSSENFRQITGYAPPPTPVTYEKYQKLGLPWFELHDGKKQDTLGSDIFEKLKPVTTGKKKDEKKK